VRIAIGSDHTGVALKESLREELTALGHEAFDLGGSGEGPVDYPDVARPLAEAVAASQYDLGVLICSNGVGMSIAANKVKGVRAALCHDTFSARRARQHTDANVLCLGSWCIGPGVAREVLKAFLEGEFEGGRHARRLEKVKAIEAEDPQGGG
jgi:ribose 5-phosphate isomerase B